MTFLSQSIKNPHLKGNLLYSCVNEITSTRIFLLDFCFFELRNVNSEFKKKSKNRAKKKKIQIKVISFAK